MSSVAVNRMLIRSSWSRPLRSNSASSSAMHPLERGARSVVDVDAWWRPRRARTAGGIGGATLAGAAAVAGRCGGCGAAPRPARAPGPRPGSSGRHSPGGRRRSASGPMRVRTRRRTGWPTASHMRRTWRLRPSWIVMRSVRSPTSDTRAGAVGPSSSSTPSRSRRSAPRDGVPSTSARYSFSTPNDGWVSRWVSSPSLVSTAGPRCRRRGGRPGTPAARRAPGRRPSGGPAGRTPWSRRRRAC